MTFKVGDRVRTVKAWRYWFDVGEVFEVVRDDGATVVIAHPTKGHGGFDASYFKSAEFNLSSATDQELADEYRRKVVEAYELVAALKARGYEILNDNGIKLAHKNTTRIIRKQELKVTSL